jgi:hypothetical protein
MVTRTDAHMSSSQVKRWLIWPGYTPARRLRYTSRRCVPKSGKAMVDFLPKCQHVVRSQWSSVCLCSFWDRAWFLLKIWLVLRRIQQLPILQGQRRVLQFEL